MRAGQSAVGQYSETSKSPISIPNSVSRRDFGGSCPGPEAGGGSGRFSGPDTVNPRACSRNDPHEICVDPDLRHWLHIRTFASSALR